jgi:copper homeostasis protein
MIRLEVCIDSVQSAIEAARGGASRVELCDSLLIGGTTPSAGCIALVRRSIDIDLHVLIRPRGGDFCYTESELGVMSHDIRLAQELGADGVAFGILSPYGEVDKTAMRKLMDVARPLKVTFHRAFDVCRDPFQALEDLIDLGVDYLLTSGQQPSVEQGAGLIAELVERAAGRITVMPGGGISEQNIASLVRITGARELHSSAREATRSGMRYQREGIDMGSISEQPGVLYQASAERVRRLIRLASSALDTKSG